MSTYIRRREEEWKEEREAHKEKMFLLVMMTILSALALYIYHVIWLQPEKLRKMLLRQGMKGPTPRFFFGNLLEMKRIQMNQKPKVAEKMVVSHEFKLFPFLTLWRKEHGSNFVFLTGNALKVFVSGHDLAKEIVSCKSLDLGRPAFVRKYRGELLGDSVSTANGDAWAHQRQLIAPEFFIDKVKGTVELMTQSTMKALESWEERIELEGGVADIKIDGDLENLTSDVIARTCFGSSYFKGKEIFSKIKDILVAIAARSHLDGIPGYRFFPSKRNREIWGMKKEMDTMLLTLINERRQAGLNKKDLLNTIIEGYGRAGSRASIRFVVGNCRAIFAAGFETTAATVKWALMLLALHPEWQARVRAEVAEVCGGRLPDYDMLRHMKLLTMVIQETMRLYPATPFITRESMQDVKFGGIWFPKGIDFVIPMSTLHQDTDNWGPNAQEFNPERFAGGVSKACKIPQLYTPFGFGPRICLGQHFAMVNMKIIISQILTKFSFKLSPSYRHSVVFKLVLHPEFGTCLLLEKV